jgi:DNA processing protein
VRVFAVPGDATQPASFGPNQLIKQGAKLVTGWEDVVEELPTPIRAELLPVETTDGERRASLVTESLAPAERTPYALLEVDKSRHVDELVVESKMNSSELLSALFEREMKGLVQQLPGKQFLKGML